MTAIAGVVQDGRVWIGGDSIAGGQSCLSARLDKKVFRLGEMVIGYTTSFRMAQIIRYHVKPIKINSSDVLACIIMEFVPVVRAAFREHGFMKVDKEREEGGTFLLGCRGHLFRIDIDFHVGENIAPFDACGCGEDLVLGSLHDVFRQEAHTFRCGRNATSIQEKII